MAGIAWQRVSREVGAERAWTVGFWVDGFDGYWVEEARRGYQAATEG